MRTLIIGGAVAATVLTLGPGAAAFALEPAFERSVSGQRKREIESKKDLENEFVKKSAKAYKLKEINAEWLWNDKVQNLQDLTKGYSLKSHSSEEILKVAQCGETVGFATSESFEGSLDVAQPTQHLNFKSEVSEKFEADSLSDSSSDESSLDDSGVEDEW